MRRVPEISVGWWGNEGGATSDLVFTFWRHDVEGKSQEIKAREVERQGDRFFVLTLPSGAVRRMRQHKAGLLEWVESIPGGDPV
jgi:hypothetical protein